MEWFHESLPYRISDVSEELQPDIILALLKTSYWAAERSSDVIVKSLEGSLCFGLYNGGSQVGFMRVVTDSATFSWVCDVIIDSEHRGKGLGKWLMSVLTNHPRISHTFMVLGTRDAHGLYEKYGFERREMMGRRPISVG
jgi:GNAT superfamily N-acetyltransferase